MSTNPYQSPTAYSESLPPPGPEKPVAGMVFGVLHLVFGVFGICGLGFSSLMFFIPMDPQMVQQNPALQLMEENQFYKLFTQAGLIFGLIFTVVLIIAGVGLLSMKSYGRTLSIVYGWYGIIVTVLTLVVNLVVVFPGLFEKMNNAPPGPAQAGAIGGVIGGIMGLLIGPIYPGLVLFFMYRPNMIAAYKNS